MFTKGLDKARVSALQVVLLALFAVFSVTSYARADYGEAMSALRGTNGLPADFRRAERLLRACAWQDDDILCQIALGDLYKHGMFPARANAYRRPVTDDVEALVWYFVSIVSVELHDATLREGRHFEVFDSRVRQGCDAAFEDVRGNPTDIEAARQRIVYIYRSRGASGWHQMGEILTGALEKTAEARKQLEFVKKKADSPWVRRGKYKKNEGDYKDSCVRLFDDPDHVEGSEKNRAHDAEARLHFLTAAQDGHPFAEDAILETEDRLIKAGKVVGAWTGKYRQALIYPPFKINGEGQSPGVGEVPSHYLTDESDTQLEHEPELNRLAQKKYHERNYLAVTALRELFPKAAYDKRVQSFRGQLNFDNSSPGLSAWETVLALKLATNSDGKRSANLLGEMYFNGVGVPVEMDRARLAFEIAAFKGEKYGSDPHSLESLKKVVAILKTNHAYGDEDIDKNAVKNLCLILASDNRFPNNRSLAEQYRQILAESNDTKDWKKKSSRNACRQNLGMEKLK